MTTPTRIGSLQSAASDTADTVAQEASRFGELARSWWTRNATAVRDAAGSMREGASALGSRTRLYVKDEPVKSVVVAAAFGAALTGLLLWLFRRDD